MIGGWTVAKIIDFNRRQAKSRVEWFAYSGDHGPRDGVVLTQKGDRSFDVEVIDQGLNSLVNIDREAVMRLRDALNRLDL